MSPLASILTPLEDVLAAGLEWLHASAGLTWGWSVIALTLIVRFLLVPVAVRQIHSMQRLQAHMPEMKAIQERYKGNRQKQNEALMAFYKENRINPASSCLPLLFQIPIFFALYFVLRDFEKEIYPKYPASDLGWLDLVPNITDAITAHWSGYVLLAIYVGSQLAASYFMSTTMQGAQRVILLAMPIVFVPFLIDPPGSTVFPIGLLMYWVTTNLWTVGQGLVTRSLRTAPEPTQKRSSRAPRADDGTSGDGAKREPRPPKPKPAATAPPRKVKRKKKARR